MSNPFERPPAQTPDTQKTLESAVGRRMHERPKKNDIVVPAEHAAEAEELLRQLGTMFEMKRSVDEETDQYSVTFPGEMLIRLEDASDENAERVFQVLRNAKLGAEIYRNEPTEVAA
jgi:hypothetical protein